jgi:hypothetical protein
VKRLLITAAAVVALATPSLAAETSMSADFVGDWCFGDGYDSQTKETNYRLPSWTQDGCDKTKILSIGRYGFTFNYWDLDCGVVSVRYTKDTAPSGTAFIAKVTAKCLRNAQNPKTKTFEFNRYKGNLYVKELVS